jgi:hypothetical protein
LVCNDIFGLRSQFHPKFVKKYADVHGTMVDALKAFQEEVQNRVFPQPKIPLEKESSGMGNEEKRVSTLNLNPNGGLDYDAFSQPVQSTAKIF